MKDDDDFDFEFVRIVVIVLILDNGLCMYDSGNFHDVSVLVIFMMLIFGF